VPARLVRDPLAVFAVAGAALYAVAALLQARDAGPVRLTAATRATLVGDFEAVAGRRADPEDIARLESDYIADELLFREAIDSGLHLTDSVVRGRLIEEMRFRVTGVLPDPTPEDLVNHYSEHLDRYRSEPSITFEHAYFRTPPADAGAVLARLRRGGPAGGGSRDGPRIGEPFAPGREFRRYGRSMVRGLFGPPFTEALWAAPPGEWSGPIESRHGWHYVRPTEHLAPALLPFNEVRGQVENDYLAAVIQEAVDRRIAELEQRHAVRIER
jgi:peptidyl-prolyl cis-trans isomerase C